MCRKQKKMLSVNIIWWFCSIIQYLHCCLIRRLFFKLFFDTGTLHPSVCRVRTSKNFHRCWNENQLKAKNRKRMLELLGSLNIWGSWKDFWKCINISDLKILGIHWWWSICFFVVLLFGGREGVIPSLPALGFKAQRSNPQPEDETAQQGLAGSCLKLSLCNTQK